MFGANLKDKKFGESRVDSDFLRKKEVPHFLNYIKHTYRREYVYEWRRQKMCHATLDRTEKEEWKKTSTGLARPICSNVEPTFS